MPKRTVAEWLTIARISRNIGHLFLEGTSDVRVIRDFFHYPSNVDFRTADEIDSDEMLDHPLCGGHKRRLVELASASTKGSSKNILCYMDGDFSLLVSHIYARSNLIETEYANLPASTLTFEWLRSLLSRSYGFVLDKPTWQFMCASLKYAFFARFLNATSEHPNSAPKLSDFVSLKRDQFYFNRGSYLARYFQISSHKTGAFSTLIEQFISETNAEIRHLANSNDIFDIIYIILRKVKKIETSIPREAVRQAYFGAFDSGIFNQQGFKEVRDWVALYP